jgi:hypothetical protein
MSCFLEAGADRARGGMGKPAVLPVGAVRLDQNRYATPTVYWSISPLPVLESPTLK